MCFLSYLYLLAAKRPLSPSFIEKALLPTFVGQFRLRNVFQKYKNKIKFSFGQLMGGKGQCQLNGNYKGEGFGNLSQACKRNSNTKQGLITFDYRIDKSSAIRVTKFGRKKK